MMSQILLNYLHSYVCGFHPPQLCSKSQWSGRRVLLEGSSLRASSNGLSEISRGGRRLPPRAVSRRSLCQCLLFHYYLQSSAAFATLVSPCGHTDTGRLIRVYFVLFFAPFGQRNLPDPTGLCK